MERATTACFTGHRPSKTGGYNPNNPLMQRIVEATTWKIWDAYRAGYRTFISGFAQGFDQEAAKLIIRLRSKYPEVRLIAAVPHEDQARPWPHAAELRWRNLLEQADEVHIVCEGGTFYNWMLQKRNEWMVDRSSLVIAAWDGSEGGTRNCLRYAYAKNVGVWKLDTLLWKASEGVDII